MTTHKISAEATIEAASAAIAGTAVAAIAIPFIASLAAGMAIYEGFTIWVLWGWFAVPLGLPTISVAHAIGLDLLISMFLPVRAIANDFPVRRYFMNALLRPPVALAIGYVALKFI